MEDGIFVAEGSGEGGEVVRPEEGEPMATSPAEGSTGNGGADGRGSGDGHDVDRSEGREEGDGDGEDKKGKEEEEDEDESAPKAVAQSKADVDDSERPRLEGRNIVFKARIVNEFLVCTLCMGYFREATTTSECLHTFCKSCIYKYFQSSSICPRCETNLGPNPMERIRFDRTLTEIVNKLFPQVIAKDLEREKEFYLARGLHLSTPTERQRAAEAGPNKRAKTAATTAGKLVALRLIPDTSSEDDTEGLKPLERSYITTREPQSLSVLHLKKLLKTKLELSSTTLLEIVYKGEIMANEYTIEYVLKSRGGAGGEPPELKYRRRKPAF